MADESGGDMAETEKLLIGMSDKREYLLLKLANRHGLIAGATGTGKTVTLQGLAEGFSDAGVPVFMADVKGDLAGLAMPGGDKPFLVERAAQMGMAGYAGRGFPVAFWDLAGELGHPVRTTISEMGPLLLGRLLGLNETQAGVLAIAFRLADDEGLLLLDLKDLRALLNVVGERASELSTRYGNVSKASIGAIQRGLVALEGQGADRFFGEPALDLADLMRTDRDGRGMINILAAQSLMAAPTLYATFLLWLLAELFETLPEVGDPEKPRLVFFFDEAHLLFDEAPKPLLDKVEQVVRLIRSKGVGIYFVTQSPTDVPDDVLAQLGNRVQHALRAFTPRDRKAIVAAAETFRPNPALDVARVLTELAVGEALVSVLEPGGVPSMVMRTRIRPPASRLGPLTPDERARIIASSPLGARYATTVDRHSAFEMLAARAAATPAAEAPPPRGSVPGAGRPGPWGAPRAEPPESVPLPPRGRASPRAAARRSDTPTEAFLKSAARGLAGQIGRELVRGLFGSIRRR
jgi:DNA helicase HerA-like ATPase